MTNKNNNQCELKNIGYYWSMLIILLQIKIKIGKMDKGSVRTRSIYQDNRDNYYFDYKDKCPKNQNFTDK